MAIETTDPTIIEACNKAAKILMDAVNNTSTSAPVQDDKILVDRGQYERMQAFVRRTYDSLPNHVSEIADFYNNMREVCGTYSRGEKP
jgi:hypothetical protein